MSSSYKNVENGVRKQNKWKEVEAREVKIDFKKLGYGFHENPDASSEEEKKGVQANPAHPVGGVEMEFIEVEQSNGAMPPKDDKISTHYKEIPTLHRDDYGSFSSTIIMQDIDGYAPYNKAEVNSDREDGYDLSIDAIDVIKAQAMEIVKETLNDIKEDKKHHMKFTFHPVTLKFNDGKEVLINKDMNKILQAMNKIIKPESNQEDIIYSLTTIKEKCEERKSGFKPNFHSKRNSQNEFFKDMHVYANNALDKLNKAGMEDDWVNIESFGK